MRRIYAVLLVSASLLLCLFASCISRDVAEQNAPDEQQADQASYYLVTFYDGPTAVQQMTVMAGAHVQNYPTEHAWRNEHGILVDFDELTVTGNMNFFAAGNVALRTGRVAYMQEEGQQFRPDEYVTRGQAAQIVSALIVPDTADVQGSYSDVPAGSQYYDAVSAVTGAGLMNGYADGTFRPDERITRGELLTVVCRLTGTAEVEALAFPDVTAEHWAMGSVAAAMTQGWISGYEDGNFYPDYPITRAETAVLVNRALGRTPNKQAIDSVFTQSPFADVDQFGWAYYDVLYAAAKSELLDYIVGGAADVSPGFVLIGEDLCHVNAELSLDYFEKGFHKIEDGLDTDGVYYVPASGYFVQRNQPGLQELDGALFYVARADGPFVCDYWDGYLYFGENGRYTSGDEEVDAFVNSIMSPIIGGSSANLLNESKLREAYNAIVFGGYGYLSRATGWVRGSNDWTLGAAKVMYQTKRGSCFYWAASFMYLARRLGYQAYPIAGGVGSDNRAHAWVMIDENGSQYIYDAELDWAYRNDYYHNGMHAMDMFKQLRGSANVLYIFPGDTYVVPPSNEDLFDDTPVVIWPTEINGTAYVEIDGEMIPLLTTWTPMMDENGNIIGYTIMAEYNGMTYTTTYMLDVEITPEPTVEPTAEPGEPTEEPVEPTEEPIEPVEPTEEPAAPTEEPAAPTEEPAAPTEEPAAPTEEPAAPTEEPVTPTEEPAAPTEEPAAPTEEPTEAPAEPTAEPSGDEPSGDEPSGDEPSGDEPSGDEPSGDEPSGDEPSGDTGGEPSGDTGGDAGGGEAPSEPGIEQPSAAAYDGLIPVSAQSE